MRGFYILAGVVFAGLVLYFPIAKANQAPSAKSPESEYFSLCKAWENAISDADTLKECCGGFRELASKYPGSIWAGRALFNIGQIREFNLREDPRLDYLSALEAVECDRSQWSPWEIKSGNEYAGHILSRLALVEFRDGNTTDCAVYVQYLMDQYSSSLKCSSILNEIHDAARTDMRASSKSKLAAVYGNLQFPESLASNFLLQMGRLRILVTLAEEDKATIASCKEGLARCKDIIRKQKSMGFPIPDGNEEYLAYYETSLQTMEHQKVQAALRYQSIHELPRLSRNSEQH